LEFLFNSTVAIGWLVGPHEIPLKRHLHLIQTKKHKDRFVRELILKIGFIDMQEEVENRGEIIVQRHKRKNDFCTGEEEQRKKCRSKNTRRMENILLLTRMIQSSTAGKRSFKIHLSPFPCI